MLWCNVGVAEVLRFACTTPSAEGTEYINYELDFDNNSARSEWKHYGKVDSDTYTIKSVDDEKVYLESNNHDQKWYFYYATDQRAEEINGEWTTYHNCKKGTSTESLNQAFMHYKKLCKEIGFKENTEAFGNCILEFKKTDMQIASLEPQRRQAKSSDVLNKILILEAGLRLLFGSTGSSNNNNFNCTFSPTIFTGSGGQTFLNCN